MSLEVFLSECTFERVTPEMLKQCNPFSCGIAQPSRDTACRVRTQSPTTQQLQPSLGGHRTPKAPKKCRVFRKGFHFASMLLYFDRRQYQVTRNIVSCSSPNQYECVAKVGARRAVSASIDSSKSNNCVYRPADTARRVPTLSRISRERLRKL